MRNLPVLLVRTWKWLRQSAAFAFGLAALLLLPASYSALQAADPPKRPNVLLILADDMDQVDFDRFGEGPLFPVLGRSSWVSVVVVD